MPLKAKRAAALTLAFLLCLAPVFALPAAAEAAQDPQAAGEVRAAQAAQAPPTVAADAYTIIDAASGQVLVSKNEHLQYCPASITKVLTVALALDAAGGKNLTDSVQVSQTAATTLMPGATTIALQTGEVTNLSDLLYAAQVVSANDAANAIAEYTSGSIAGFADRMNQKAAELGLSDSHFTNPSGQTDQSHVTTAYDMAQITRWALTVPGYRDYFSAQSFSMEATNFRATPTVYNATNSILVPASRYYYEWVTGSKQGYTDDAQFTLVTSAEKNGMELICVVMHCGTNFDKYNSTETLLDYCFNNYRPFTFPATDVADVQVPVYGGGFSPLGDITVRATQDMTFLLPTDVDTSDLQVKLNVPERYVIGQPFAPTVEVHAGGEAAGRVLASAPLVWDGLDEVLADNTFSRPFDNVIEVIPVPFWIVAGVLLAAILLMLAHTLYVRRQRMKRQEAKLAAARMRWPAKLEDRPAPSAPPRDLRVAGKRVTSYAAAREAAGAAQPLRAAEPQEYVSPRRVGQAR